MKKILLVCSFIMGLSAVASAQCTPGPEFGNGIYPDTITNLVKGCKGVPYTQVVSVRVPEDTNIVYNNVPVTAKFNYIKIDSVQGMPTGLNYACNPTSCSFPGQSDGCAIITGTCNIVDTFGLTFFLMANVTISPLPAMDQPQVFTGYRIIIEDCQTTGLPMVSVVTSFDVYPNPAKGNVTVSNLSEVGGKNIHIYNTEGKVVKTIFTELDAVSFSTESLETGIYFVKVKQNNKEETVKLVIE
jgi:hypothetical protein